MKRLFIFLILLSICSLLSAEEDFLAPAYGTFREENEETWVYLNMATGNEMIYFYLDGSLEEMNVITRKVDYTDRVINEGVIKQETGILLRDKGFYKLLLQAKKGSGRWICAILSEDEAKEAGFQWDEKNE